jgi:hypothetical protein
LNVLRTLTCVRVVIRTFQVTPPTALWLRQEVCYWLVRERVVSMVLSGESLH